MAKIDKVKWNAKWQVIVEDEGLGGTFGTPPVRGVRKRSVKGANRKHIVDVAEKIADLAQTYADAQPSKQDDSRYMGGIRSRGASGMRGAYPFRISNSRPNRGERPYRTLFTADREVVGGARFAVVGNTSSVSSLVEYGSEGVSKVPRRITVQYARRKAAKFSTKGTTKYQESWYRIPLKKSAYAKMRARTYNMSYAERRRRRLPSSHPDYKAWSKYNYPEKKRGLSWKTVAMRRPYGPRSAGGWNGKSRGFLHLFSISATP